MVDFRDALLGQWSFAVGEVASVILLEHGNSNGHMIVFAAQGFQVIMVMMGKNIYIQPLGLYGCVMLT